MNKVRLGILGCGAIAPAYLQNFRQHFGKIVEVDIRFPEKAHPAEGANAGKTFKVGFPSTFAAALTFADGSVGSLLSSRDGSGYYPPVELHGSISTLVLNDANSYQGEITLIGRKKTRRSSRCPAFAKRDVAWGPPRWPSRFAKTKRRGAVAN